MSDKYVLDACSLIAFYNDEEGADVVHSLLKRADTTELKLYLHKLNFLEIYYGYLKDGKDIAGLADNTTKTLPISIIDSIDDILFYEAARIKANYRLSLADAIALSLAKKLNASVVTADHHEFNIVENKEAIEFLWIR
jgi:predicted nucleic acid-binding protein